MNLYNTLTRRVEPLDCSDGIVNMYVCGITPYSSSHLGHAMCAVLFDVIRRYLEYKGFRVNHIQNFTDIDDKMIVAANETGVTVKDLAEENIEAYLNELQILNVLPATQYPKATEEIASIVKVIEGLIEKQYAYEVNGDVYFRVRNDRNYGKLSRRNLDEMLSGARLEVDESKEYPGDFALWKSEKPGEPSWDSPWGKGRPGWHIECTAMSLGYLENRVDIHGGGLDLVFPHHENEIAQSEAYTGTEPFSRFWVHNGTLGYGEEKMSKSLGNVFTIQAALDVFTPESLRLFFVSSHYRSPLIFADESVYSQGRAIDRLKNAMNASSGMGEEIDHNTYKNAFEESMDDDLNTPKALGVIFDLAREINRKASKGGNVETAQAVLADLLSVLGIDISSKTKHSGELEPYIDLLIRLRTDLRDEKQFAMADKIRDELSVLGIKLEDNEGATRWLKE